MRISPEARKCILAIIVFAAFLWVFWKLWKPTPAISLSVIGVRTNAWSEGSETDIQGWRSTYALIAVTNLNDQIVPVRLKGIRDCEQLNASFQIMEGDPQGGYRVSKDALRTWGYECEFQLEPQASCYIQASFVEGTAWTFAADLGARDILAPFVDAGLIAARQQQWMNFTNMFVRMISTH